MLGRVFKSWSVTQAQSNQHIKKPIQNKQPPKKSLLLPDQISGRILDLQMQCQKQTISKQIVFELLGQYTKAVQFYQQQGNDKYKLYQRRMQQFLAKPLIQSILKGQSGQMIIKKQRTQETLRKAQNKAQKQVKQLIQKQQEKQKKHESIIKQQLNKQDQILEQRIRKKRTMSNRSMQSKKDDDFNTNTNANNEESSKKARQTLNMKLFIAGIEQRNHTAKKVFL